MSDKKFPVLKGYAFSKKFPDFPSSVPWNMLDEEMAEKNHSQTLTRLAERGGLSPLEMVLNIEKRDLFDFDKLSDSESVEKLLEHINKFSEADIIQKKQSKHLYQSTTGETCAKCGLGIRDSIHIKGFEL